MDKYIIYKYSKTDSIATFDSLLVDELIINSLQKEQLIKVAYDEWFVDQKEQYSTLFDNVKSRYKIKADEKLTYKKGIIQFTKLGENFAKTCIN